MSSIRTFARTAFRTTLVAFAIAGASTATVTHVQADLPALQVSSNLHCGTLTIGVTMFNNTAADTVGNVVLQSSLQNSSSTATVPANGAVDVSFPVAIGERLDKLILRDSNLTVVHTIFYDQVITGTGDCVRPAFDLVEMTGYSLTCANGLTQAAITIENNGDYPADMFAQGSASLPTEAEYQAAIQQGLISTDSETFTLAPGNDRVVELAFKVIDAIAVRVDRGQTSVFADGPRNGAGAGADRAPAPRKSGGWWWKSRRTRMRMRRLPCDWTGSSRLLLGGTAIGGS